MKVTRLPSLLILLCSVSLSFASSGDNAFEFRDCVSRCQSQRGCTSAGGARSHAQTFPRSLRLTRWTCLDNCKYECMHEISDAAATTGERLHQYHGKWPFYRWLGMQEPASVLFSLGNLFVHIAGWKKVRREMPVWHPMKRPYLAWALCGMNAWVWSAVFHTRDKPLTEKLDYFSAALAIISALYYTFIRLFHLSPRFNAQRLTKTTSSSTRSTLQNLLFVLLTVIYAAHILYLSASPRFDYTYNTIFNLALGLLHNLLWTFYALPSSIFTRLPFPPRFPGRQKSYRPQYVSKVGWMVVLMTLATGLEVFDFAPWGRVIDAHSLWHAATIPIGWWWYEFILQDAADPGWREGFREARS